MWLVPVPVLGWLVGWLVGFANWSGCLPVRARHVLDGCDAVVLLDDSFLSIQYCEWYVGVGVGVGVGLSHWTFSDIKRTSSTHLHKRLPIVASTNEAVPPPTERGTVQKFH